MSLSILLFLFLLYYVSFYSTMCLSILPYDYISFYSTLSLSILPSVYVSFYFTISFFRFLWFVNPFISFLWRCNPLSRPFHPFSSFWLFINVNSKRGQFDSSTYNVIDSIYRPKKLSTNVSLTHSHRPKFQWLKFHRHISSNHHPSTSAWIKFNCNDI